VTLATIDAAAMAAHLRSPLRDVQVRDAERVDDDHIGQRRDGHDRPAHRFERRAVDIELVDFGGLNGGNRPGDRLPGDERVEALALERRDRLGIREAGDVVRRIENDGAGHHRAGQTAAPDFIAAGDAIEPPTPQGVLEGSHRANSNHEQEPGTWNPEPGTA
jgi:hypothetical protein